MLLSAYETFYTIFIPARVLEEIHLYTNDEQSALKEEHLSGRDTKECIVTYLRINECLKGSLVVSEGTAGRSSSRRVEPYKALDLIDPRSRSGSLSIALYTFPECLHLSGRRGY